MNDFDHALLGRAPAFAAVVRAASLVAAIQVTVLIQGESGTGKDLLARAIHDASPWRHGPFVAINCAALPESLAEAELFGHAKGAFTGAVTERKGRIQAAAGGTLFLDEVAELPMAVQGKLLRFLETGECQPVGEALPRRVEARVVAATHRDLRAMVQRRAFREDLFYRLHVVPLEMPPLRERRGDIGLLLDHFTNTLAARHGRPAARFGAEARKRLEQYDWPGNVRELRNLCERMVVMYGGAVVGVSELPYELQRQPKPTLAGFELPSGGINFTDLEHHLISQALHQSQGNQTRAARLLGLTRDTLLYRMKKYAIQG